MRALLVVSDLITARPTTALLQNAGITVETADRGEDALQMSRLDNYDLILLARLLPDMSGYDLIRRLRTARTETSAIVLCDSVTSAEKVKLLGAGADDIVVKPCDSEELLARIRAVVRRARGFSQPSLAVGPLVLDLSARAVTVTGQPVHLTPKEYAILELLVLRRGQAVTKEAFLSRLYSGFDEPEGKIIDVYICKVRKKLAAAGAHDLISNIWGRGYILREPATGPCSTPALPLAA